MDEELKPPSKANLASDAPAALPPATDGSARGTSPVVWIVAAVVGVLAVGGLLFGCLICAGAAVFLSPTNASPEFEYAESPISPTYVPTTYAPPVESMPTDAWSAPAYSGDYSTETTLAPEAPPPAEEAYGPTFAESLYAEPEASYDPDWQLELDQSTQDAIQDLNNQKEMFGDP